MDKAEIEHSLKKDKWETQSPENKEWHTFDFQNDIFKTEWRIFDFENNGKWKIETNKSELCIVINSSFTFIVCAIGPNYILLKANNGELLILKRVSNC